jgi:hypothetical protein
MGLFNRGLAFLTVGAIAIAVIAMPSYSLIVAFCIAVGGDPRDLPLLIVIGPFVLVILAAGAVAFCAPSGRRAWGRLALLVGLGCFALPIAAFIFSAFIGAATPRAEGVDHQATANALFGMSLLSALAFVEFFLGMILVFAAHFVLRGAPRTYS